MLSPVQLLAALKQPQLSTSVNPPPAVPPSNLMPGVPQMPPVGPPPFYQPPPGSMQQQPYSGSPPMYPPTHPSAGPGQAPGVPSQLLSLLQTVQQQQRSPSLGNMQPSPYGSMQPPMPPMGSLSPNNGQLPPNDAQFRHLMSYLVGPLSSSLCCATDSYYYSSPRILASDRYSPSQKYNSSQHFLFTTAG